MAQQQPKPVYVLVGNDAFLRSEFRRQAIAQVIDKGDPQVCVSAFDADAPLADVLDELRTIPFLAPRRAVVVEDADAFVSAYRQQLEEYLSAPSENSSLVLIVSSWPGTTRLAKLVGKIGQTFDCSAPDSRSLARWIREAAGRRGKKIAPDAAELLADWVGADLAALDSELEKLSLYAAQRQTITAEDVSALVAATTGPGAFDLTNAVIAGDAKAALTALDGMLTRRGEEFRILGLLASHLRKALKAQQLSAAGKRPESVLPPNIPPAPKAAFLKMLSRRPIAKLQDDFRRLIAADLGMKSGLEPSAAMQELVAALCQ